MIRSLRKKFIVTAMLSVFAALLLIVGGINIVSYAGVVKNAGIRMDFLAANGAQQFPPEFPDGEKHRQRQQDEQHQQTDGPKKPSAARAG